ncbi:DedA family protein [Luethyella okanaganae]|uniref:DedA family protein n=1 Tax=Luethyella okanaganae TaxID=69372 RepID=A0ABW1VAW9_9MICO
MLRAAALDQQLSDLLSDVGVLVFYLVVWGLVFAGTALFVGAFVPFVTGDSLLFASGLIAAAASGVDIWVLAIGTGIAAFLGDQIGFLLGRRYGRPYLDRRGGPRTRKAIDRTEAFYRTFGWWSVVIARFMPWARVFVPLIAGVGNMGYYRFLTANVVGALAWGVGITVVGYFAASIPEVRVAAYVIAGVFIFAAIVAGIRAWRADRVTADTSEG